MVGIAVIGIPGSKTIIHYLIIAGLEYQWIIHEFEQNERQQSLRMVLSC